ncbi:MAG: hypothetical protein IBX56_12385 [Methylomicrobium sp.]|nr:hypothetical protein [Methylomicrobium sp.]
MNEKALIDAIPDVVSFGGLLKASASEEGGRRFLYFEASNEDRDIANEIVLQKALEESADYYLRHGNVDLSHYTILGPRSGLDNFLEYEVGKPVAVRVDGSRTFVKAELYQGESPMAQRASMVWDSLTKQSPPSRWYPSVGGSVLSKSIKIDPATGEKLAVIDKVRWNNVALDRCPVSKTVPEVSTMPTGVFVKSLGAFVMTKALEAGYGTDSAGLVGGGALRGQSLHGAYTKFRDRFAEMLRSGKVGRKPDDMTGACVTRFGMSRDTAERFVEQFLFDLNREVRKR